MPGEPANPWTGERPMQANQVWQAVLSELGGAMARHDFETLLKTSTIAAFDDGQAIVAMPNAYAAEWSDTRLAGTVERILGRIVGYPVAVRFAVRDGDSYYLPAANSRTGATANGAQNGQARGADATASYTPGGHD